MKRIAIYILLIFFSKKSLAMYTRIFLPRLIEKSSVIVYGKIIAVDFFTIKIISLDKIKGNNIKDTLEILKFEDWTCASRYAEYKTDEEAIFFLQMNEQNKFRVMGAGNEGELTVKGDTAYYPGFYSKKYEERTIVGFPKYNQYIPVSLRTVITGIELYLENRELIEKQISTEDGHTVYSNPIDDWPKNKFLEMIIDQKRAGHK